MQEIGGISMGDIRKCEGAWEMREMKRDMGGMEKSLHLH